MIIFKYLYKEYNSVYSNSQPFYKKLTCFLPEQAGVITTGGVFWHELVTGQIICGLP
jgi:hypothetical protein